MAKTAPKHFFSHNPSVNQQRTLFDMSKTDTVTLNTDYYYPNYCLMVCPGDTVVLDYSNMIRLLDPLQVPMMDNLYCDTHFWFVPFDIAWHYTEEFFGAKKRPSDPDVNSLPIIEFDSSDNTKPLPALGSIYDYFGIPITGTDNLLSGSFSVNALPFLSYYLIHDDWIRDEQRVDYLLDTPDFTKTTFKSSDFALYKRGKRFDYFTSTLLNPQVGTPVTLPLGTTAPVIGNGYAIGLRGSIGNGNIGDAGMISSFNSGGNGFDVVLGSTTQALNKALGTTSYVTGTGSSGGTAGFAYSIHGASASTGAGIPVGLSTSATNSNVVADLSNASAITVEALRRAFQVQAYNEILARYGSQRYTEYLYAVYGTINPDIELQRPEFLGQTHQRLSVQPIVQNSATQSNAPLGDLGAIVSGGVSDSVFTRSFTRFGYIIGCINIYADLTYYQGLEKHWSIRDKEEFPNNIFANLTDQPVYKGELVLTGTSSDSEVFGYNEIYAWAKYAQNSLRGLVRPNAPTSIGYWSLAEQFSSVPVNNDTFIQMNTPINRITNVGGTDNSTQHFICNQKFDVKLTRELPMHSDPMKWMFRG